jgi:hypothetical protein
MASEGPFTVPRMGSFKRSFLGYRPPEVDAAIAARDRRIAEVKRQSQAERVGLLAERDADVAAAEAARDAAEAELSSLSGMVIEREREIRSLTEQLREAHERNERSIESLDSVTVRLQEIEAQARGQATRIRMKALREAVEVSRRVQELSEAEAPAAEGEAESNGHAEGNGHAELSPQEIFEGLVKVEIGPLGDFSQLVSLEDAIGQIGGAGEISIERFSEGRATLSMQLDEPIELLRELEERAPLEFRVRRVADDNLILDVDEDQGPEQRAA